MAVRGGGVGLAAEPTLPRGATGFKRLVAEHSAASSRPQPPRRRLPFDVVVGGETPQRRRSPPSTVEFGCGQSPRRWRVTSDRQRFCLNKPKLLMNQTERDLLACHLDMSPQQIDKAS